MGIRHNGRCRVLKTAHRSCGLVPLTGIVFRPHPANNGRFTQVSRWHWEKGIKKATAFVGGVDACVWCFEHRQGPRYPRPHEIVKRKRRTDE